MRFMPPVLRFATRPAREPRSFEDDVLIAPSGPCVGVRYDAIVRAVARGRAESRLSRVAPASLLPSAAVRLST